MLIVSEINAVINSSYAYSIRGGPRFIQALYCDLQELLCFKLIVTWLNLNSIREPDLWEELRVREQVQRYSFNQSYSNDTDEYSLEWLIEVINRKLGFICANHMKLWRLRIKILKFNGFLDFSIARNWKTRHFGNWVSFCRQAMGDRHLLCWVP
jgi:abortive infection bacteriophage resistance protein